MASITGDRSTERMISQVRTGACSSIYFLELLTFRSWFGFVAPLLFSSKPLYGAGWSTCFVFEASRPGWWIAKATGWMVGLKLKKFDYRLADVCLPDGELAWLRVQEER